MFCNEGILSHKNAHVMIRFILTTIVQPDLQKCSHVLVIPQRRWKVKDLLNVPVFTRVQVFTRPFSHSIIKGLFRGYVLYYSNCRVTGMLRVSDVFIKRMGDKVFENSVVYSEAPIPGMFYIILNCDRWRISVVRLYTFDHQSQEFTYVDTKYQERTVTTHLHKTSFGL